MPSTSCVTRVACIAWLLFGARLLCAQDANVRTAESPPFTLPIADQAVTDAAADSVLGVVIEIGHAGLGAQPCPAHAANGDRACTDATHWRTTFFQESSSGDPADQRVIVSTPSDLASATRPVQSSSSERSVMVRADSGAPYIVVRDALASAAAIGIRKVSIVAAPSRAFVAVARIACDLSVESAPSASERRPIRVMVGSDPDTGMTQPIVILLGRAPVVPPEPGVKGLQAAIREVYDASGNAARANEPLVVDATANVAWQDVVRVVNAAKREGIVTVMLTVRSGHAATRPIQPVSDVRRSERLTRRTALAGQIQSTDAAVMAGLDWLRRHQDPSGGWGGAGFPDRCDEALGTPCGGIGSPARDTLVTGLALMAFLGAGYDDARPSSYRDAVSRGLRFLASTQGPAGSFASSDLGRSIDAQACATMAMCEAHHATRRASWRRCADRALAALREYGNPEKAWRDGVRSGDDARSPTGWMLLALRAAQEAGIAADGRYTEEALGFLDAVSDPETGRTGYLAAGDAPLGVASVGARALPTASEALTAEALACRFLCRPAAPVHLEAKASARLSARLPRWDAVPGSVDAVYWYWGSLAAFQAGGELWTQWAPALEAALLEHQVKTGCARGSWDPADSWAVDAGRVGTTALMTMCLETRYRFPRLRN